MVLATIHSPVGSSPELIVDCLALHQGAQKPAQVLDAKCRFSGFWREVDRHLGAGWIRTKWVKSHRDAAYAENEEAEYDIVGNAQADGWANDGARLHGLTAQE